MGTDAAKSHGRMADGTPITDEVADALADEAERGYDLNQARRVGRPSLAQATGKSPRINLRITEELHGRAIARAEQEGKTVSQVAREALESYFAEGSRTAR
jgi:predicted HicB family RNase H-like nuclease